MRDSMTWSQTTRWVTNFVIYVIRFWFFSLRHSLSITLHLSQVPLKDGGCWLSSLYDNFKILSKRGIILHPSRWISTYSSGNKCINVWYNIDLPITQVGFSRKTSSTVSHQNSCLLHLYWVPERRRIEEEDCPWNSHWEILTLRIVSLYFDWSSSSFMSWCGFLLAFLIEN